MFNLKNKVAVVTGGRQGMGRTHALILAKAGAKVVVSDISKEDCQKVVDEIEKQGQEAIAVKCDVLKKDNIDKMIKETLKRFNRIDILVNNAGIVQFAPFLELTEKDWDKMIDINLKGYFLCAQRAAKEMIKQKSGAIVNIASIAMGQVGIGFNGLVHYCATKGGITAMTEAMALDLAPYNIRVNAIAPGMIDTPMVNSIKQDPKAMEGTLARIPLRRAGRPEEVSSAVLFLSSDESSYITGATLTVDGGWLAG
ncbi:MAG: glucose 1-dehydrogenase [Candidatus Pacebacteria bacterium]|nr:glucose 1-dehydrogenase [Candidatus Paceibacterota bacterium]